MAENRPLTEKTFSGNTILEGITNNDIKFIKIFFYEYVPIIGRALINNGASVDDAEDVCQEVTKRILERARCGTQKPIKGSFFFYFKKVCILEMKNLARNQLRKTSLENIEISDETMDISRTLDENMKDYIYKKHLGKLSSEERKILEMTFDNIDISAIAVELNMSVNYLYRKRRNIRDNLFKAIRNDPFSMDYIITSQKNPEEDISLV